MPSHDPLTPSQLTLLKEIEKGPLTTTIGREIAANRHQDLEYLMRLELITVELTHHAQDVANNTYVYTRTKKAVD